MDPQLLRGQFALALLILLLALLILPLQDPNSGGFVVTVLAVVVAVIFIAVIAAFARYWAPRVPEERDKRRRTGYNGRTPGIAASAPRPRTKERDDD